MTNRGRFRAALRIARRDASRHKARSALVVVMIALPVLALTGADVLARTMQLSTAEKLDRSLGRADAALTIAGGHISQYPSGTGWTSDGAPALPGTAAYADTERRLRAELPAGSRVIDDVAASARAATSHRLARDIEIHGVDLRDPMTVGIARIVGGRAPASDTEVALTAGLAHRLKVSVGSSITIGTGRFTDVGVVRDPEAVRADVAYLLPSAIATASTATATSPQLLVMTPRPVTWADVQRLNGIGVAVRSRYVVEHPPRGVPTADSGTLATRARTLGIATVAVGLAVLEVVLLAGAAFAVGARRQRRDLALLAAAGGDQRDVRRVVLSGGLVLGVVGAVVGVAAGVVTGDAALPLAARLADSDPGHFDVRLPELLAIAVIGIATGVAAAVMPARSAARDDVVAALTGRRGVVATARRVPVVGLLMIVLGAAAAAYAAHPPARFTLVLGGAVVAEIGFVVCAPAVVGVAGRAARLLPLTLRLALRDASRHRGRTGPAVAAVLAAVAGSVAVSAWITSTVAQGRDAYRPTLRIGQSAVQVVPDSSRKPVDPAVIRAAVMRDLPASTVIPLATTQCFTDNCTTVYIRPNPQCSGGQGCTVEIGPGSVAIGDTRVLDALLGHHDRAAAAALEAGRLVVFAPTLARGGRSVLVVEHSTGSTGDTNDVGTSSYVTDVGRRGAAVDGVMSAATASRLHVTGHPWGYLLTTSRLPTTAEVDTAQADLGQWNGNVIVERGYQPERWNYGLLALAGAAAIITLGATAIATALSAADSRPDLVTLAAVGAAPRLRRRFAASQAATVAVLGTVLGAVAGLIPAWAVIRAHGNMPFAMPWQSVLLVVAIVPVLASTGTAVLTRSRLPSERRTA